MNFRLEYFSESFSFKFCLNIMTTKTSNEHERKLNSFKIQTGNSDSLCNVSVLYIYVHSPVLQFI